MKYDFQTIVNRNGCGAVKWEAMRREDPTVGEDIVPLSVADMEFVTPPEIVQGLKSFLDGAVLGYTEPTQGYLDAVCGWMGERHGWAVEPQWIVPTPGVKPALCAAIQTCTKPGEGVLLMTPVYYPFYEMISSRGRRVVKSPLINNGGRYEIDFEDLAAKASRPEVTMLILCSPHNPVGRVWSRQELEKIGRICLESHVLVVSDEIHFDLVMPGCRHTMLGSVSRELAQNAITCTAPSKSFNLAGLQLSNIIIPNPELREKMTGYLEYSAMRFLNILSYQACQIAYTKCGGWLEELLGVISGNRDYVVEYLAARHPQVKVTPLEGTYLLWLDFRALGLGDKELETLMRREARLFFDEGYIFGQEGSGFERMNLACPRSVVEAAMGRLTQALERLEG